MGTTKLTRKEILAEDPVHVAIIQLIEFFRERGRLIAIVVAGAAIIGVGVYFTMEYLDSRDLAAQYQFGKALEYYHARIDAAAPEDSSTKRPEPVFRSDAARLQAADKEFSNLIAKYGSSKVGVIARYYHGLCQLRLGNSDEGVRSLEAVRNNTKDRTLGYLAKKVLARHDLDARNFKGAQEILEGMIKDPQCELPKEDLRLDLARVYEAQGKRDEAIKVLRQARDESSRSMLQSTVGQELNRLEGNGGAKPQDIPPATAVRP